MPKQVLDTGHHTVHTNPLIWCAAIICTILSLVVIFTGIFVFITYLTIKPKVPEIGISKAQLNTIYFDQASLLTVQVTVVVKAENHNAKARADFYDTRFTLSYRGRRIAYLMADPFGVSANNSVELNFVPESSPIPLNPEEADDVNSSLRNGLVTFEVQGTTRTRWRIGLIGSVKFWLHLRCFLHLPVDKTIVYLNCSTGSH